MKKTKKQIIQAIEYSIQNPTISVTKVGELFGVGRHTISKYKLNDEYLKYTYCNQTNIDDECLYYFEDSELEFINLYLNNPTLAYKEICAQASISPTRQTLYHWLEILGQNKTEGKSIRYHYNRKAFATIDTEEDAYWLGFITADGCIVENKWLYIGLAEKDRDHLKKFCAYLGLSDKETDEIIKNSYGGAYDRKNPICGIKICSLEIINNLKDKGITPKKSGKEKPYICNSKELEKAYIRGLIDGDGFIGSTQKRVGLVGSYEICEYVKNFISKYIQDISNHGIYEHGTIFKLELTGRVQSTKIINYFYKDAKIYLDRKFELAKTYN